MITIASGPKVRVLVKLNKIELSLSDCFCLEMAEEQPLLIQWLSLYAQKKQPAPLLLQLDKPAFTHQILSKLQTIPFGQTTTYRGLAEEIGRPKAARAVGNACGSNPFPLLIPCHRVLHTTGGLGGFSCGLEIKRRLLAFEGVDLVR